MAFDKNQVEIRSRGGNTDRMFDLVLRQLASLAVCLALVFGSNISAVAFQLGEDEFTTLHEQLNPASEAWQAIPWHSDLVSAQRLAAEQEKPSFIWAMDGHPLTCT